MGQEWKYYTAVLCGRDMTNSSAWNSVEAMGRVAKKQPVCITGKEGRCVEEENHEACGRLNQASCLLLKHINCIFIFHFQLLERKRVTHECFHGIYVKCFKRQ